MAARGLGTLVGSHYIHNKYIFRVHQCMGAGLNINIENEIKSLLFNALTVIKKC